MGGSTRDLLGRCREGYKGLLCGECDGRDYYKANWQECAKCPSFGTTLGFAFLRVLAIVIYVSLCTWLTVKIASKYSPQQIAFVS